MSGDRFNYYLKMILNASLDEYQLVSEQFQNDPQVSEAEADELERLIRRYMGIYNRFNFRVVNSSTGEEELPPQTSLDNFGGNAKYEGNEKLYGVEWKVYTPKENFENSPVRKWYYNEKIALILNEVLGSVVPGSFKNYFDLPPWVLGTVYAPGTIYVPLTELINLAIAKGTLPNWDYLVTKGLPRELVAVLKATDLGSTL